MGSQFRTTRFAIALAVCSMVCAGCSHSVSTLNPGNSTLLLPDSVKTMLNGQAPIIGFYAAVAQDSNYFDTAQLPAWASARAYQAIGMLWQTKGIAERDTVIDVFAIKAMPRNDFHDVIISCSNTPEKYSSVLAKYQFSRDTVLPITVYHSPRLLNTVGVAREINDSLGLPRSPFFMCAEPNWLIGPGDDVQARFEQGAVKLTYSVGYGDCPSGCMAHRYWDFRVYDSGDVRFLGASGDRPPTKEEHH